jgi:hypothetical protein
MSYFLVLPQEDNSAPAECPGRCEQTRHYRQTGPLYVMFMPTAHSRVP